MSFDFHIFHDKKEKLVNQKLTPLVLTKDGKIWLALCTISVSSAKVAGNIILRKEKEPYFYEYSLVNHEWTQKNSFALTEEEHEILRLSAQGYTMNEIANMIFKSIDSVKSCKKNCS